jgi:hypothetical protein
MDVIWERRLDLTHARAWPTPLLNERSASSAEGKTHLNNEIKVKPRNI